MLWASSGALRDVADHHNRAAASCGNQHSRPEGSMTSSSDQDRLGTIESCLNKISNSTGLSAYAIFEDWLEVIIASLAGDDDRYNSLVEDYQGRYRNETVQIVFELYAEAFGELVLATEPTDRDTLGNLYERFRLTSEQFAQHFTPESICRALARMSIPDETEIRNATVDDPLQIGDPTCGSGRLLIATARHLRTFAPEVPVLFVGQDIDSTCARMAVINFALHDIPGFVIQGDSLTEEVVRCWRIDPLTHSGSGWPIQRISPEEVPIEAD